LLRFPYRHISQLHKKTLFVGIDFDLLVQVA